MKVLKKLKQYLDNINYTILIKAIAGNDFYSKPWKKVEHFRFGKLPIDKKEVIKLFYLGESIVNIRETVKDDLLIYDLLAEHLIIIEGEGYIFNHHRIIPYMGLYIIIDAIENRIDNEYVWFGEDSIFLSNILPYQIEGKVLDMCTGSGVQALILGSRGMHVKAIDLNPKAVATARQNIIMNNLEDKIEVLEGNLFEVLGDETFDLIVSNPPFLPMLSNTNNIYYYADGGEDGLNIIRIIVEESNKYLSQNGKMMIIGGGFGDEIGPFYRSELYKLTIQNKWYTTLILIGQNDAKSELKRLSKSLHELNKEVEKIMTNLGADSLKYYSFILTIDKSFFVDGVEINDCSVSWREYMNELRKNNRIL